ncbi:serine-rich adhesin for platelets-like isoform X2 [Xyrauchen texanus]|uniref:serine-rich adhesin for platelets-like isoform X2 n=1 Tax=Xyrauchen texanus TaxID=154827 RepID=UPI002241F346|nr:serine-rich adhesin for platelets-like isoform X2 [Xyrauchen texanus]
MDETTSLQTPSIEIQSSPSITSTSTSSPVSTTEEQITPEFTAFTTELSLTSFEQTTSLQTPKTEIQSSPSITGTSPSSLFSTTDERSTLEFTASTKEISSTGVDETASLQTPTTQLSTTEGQSISEITTTTTVISLTSVEETTSLQTPSTEIQSSPSITGTSPSSLLSTIDERSTLEFTASTKEISSTGVDETASLQTPTTQLSTTEGQSTPELTGSTTEISSTKVEETSSTLSILTREIQSSPSITGSSPSSTSSTKEVQITSELTGSTTDISSTSIEKTTSLQTPFTDSQSSSSITSTSPFKLLSTTEGQSTSEITTTTTVISLTSVDETTSLQTPSIEIQSSPSRTGTSPSSLFSTTDEQSTLEFTASTKEISSTGVDETSSRKTPTTQMSTTEGQSTPELTTSTTVISLTSVEETTSLQTPSTEIQSSPSITGSSPSSTSSTKEVQITPELTGSTTEISSTSIEKTTSLQTPFTDSQSSSSTTSTSPFKLLSTIEGQSTSEITTNTTVISLTSVEETTSLQTPSTEIQSSPSRTGSSPSSTSSTKEGQITAEFTASTKEISSTSLENTTRLQTPSTEIQFSPSITGTSPSSFILTTPISMTKLESPTSKNVTPLTNPILTTVRPASPASPSFTTEGKSTSEFISSTTELFPTSVEETKSLPTQTIRSTPITETQYTLPTQSPLTTTTTPISTTKLETTTENGSTLPNTLISTVKSPSFPFSTKEGQTASAFTTSIQPSSTSEQTRSQQTQTTLSTATTEKLSTQSTFFTTLATISIMSSESAAPTTTTSFNQASIQTPTQTVSAQTFNISTPLTISSPISASTETTLPHSTKPQTSSSTSELPSSATIFTSISTTHNCNQCQCSGSPCVFNETSGKCQCQCKPFTFGDSCNFASSSSSVSLSGSIPTRKANISLRIMMDYISDYDNLKSPNSQKLIAILRHELYILCKRADAQNFKDVHILRLKPGSVIADSIAEYNYPNNNSQIHFLNQDLGTTLENIFNDSHSLNLGTAFGNASIQYTVIAMQRVEIANISDLQTFVHCSVDFANFTVEIENGSWICAGPCKKIPKYCNQHGQCLNEKSATVCQCDRSYFEEFYGSRCELYRRGAGFYAILFGSLAAFVLLLIVLAVMIVVLYRGKRMSSIRKISLFDDYFEFTPRGFNNKYVLHRDFPVAEDSTPRYYKNSLVRERPEQHELWMSHEQR